MTKNLESAPRVRRTSTTLADGRELIYFDDSEPYLSGARLRDAVDERPLDARPVAGTMRLDALTGDWVSIANHRQNRTFLPRRESALCVRPVAGRCLRRYRPMSMTWLSSRTVSLRSQQVP